MGPLSTQGRDSVTDCDRSQLVTAIIGGGAERDNCDTTPLGGVTYVTPPPSGMNFKAESVSNGGGLGATKDCASTAFTERKQSDARTQISRLFPPSDRSMPTMATENTGRLRGDAPRRKTAPRHPRSPTGKVQKRDVFRSVRFAQWEDDLVREATMRSGLSWSTFAREILLQTAAAVMAGPEGREDFLAGLRQAAVVIAEGLESS